MKEKKEMKSKEETIILQKCKNYKEEKLRERGITLIALVVTIIILLILAGVTLNIAIGQNGLFSRAQNAADRYKLAQENEVGMLVELENQIGNLTNNQQNETPKEKSQIQKAKESQEKFENTTPLTDEKGNTVVVPGKFHISSESGDTVEEGIVIEDDDGNQFVWIPVSNVDGDNNEIGNEQNLITKNDGTKVEITLGRYTFDTSNGNTKLIQVGASYASTVPIDSKFQETSTHKNGGTPAKNLQAFVNSVKKNYGYYFARYEAGKEVNKVVSKRGMTVYYGLTQSDAASLARNLFNGNSYVDSDLMNSYAWDTAIVYIQKMGNENYANTNREINTTLMKTGELGEQKCNVYDMAGNISEWTTEYCSIVVESMSRPVVHRGDAYNRGTFTVSSRGYALASNNGDWTGFRPLLYLINSDN